MNNVVRLIAIQAIRELTARDFHGMGTGMRITTLRYELS